MTSTSVLSWNLGLPGPHYIEFTNESVPTAGNFGKNEVEISAGRLLKFLQSLGSQWHEFKLDELFHFYQSQGWDPNRAFFGLTGLWFDDGLLPLSVREAAPYVVCIGNEWAVTNLFVERCMDNPNKKPRG